MMKTRAGHKMLTDGMQREQLTEVVMDGRSRNLPEDLLKTVLAGVPIPTLKLRYKRVCKRWAAVIAKPTFQAKAKPRATYVFMSANAVKPSYLNDNWEICDTENDKRYILNQDFLLQKYRNGWNPEAREFTLDDEFARDHLSRCTIAADGGFVAVLWQYAGWDNAIFIVNPVTESCQEIPCFPRTSIWGSAAAFGSQNPCFAMMVAEDHLSFRLFVIQEASQHPRDPETKHRCFVFDSRIGKWRLISDPPTEMQKPCHMLKMGKTLFTIFFNYNSRHTPNGSPSLAYELYAYDTDEDVWTKMGEPPQPEDDELPFWIVPQLVACSGRLFFTAWGLHEKLRIWEVDLAEKTHIFVAESPVEDASRLLPEHVKICGIRLNPHVHYTGSTGTNVLAFGTNDGRVLFSSVTNECLAFVLSDHAWVHAPVWDSFMPVEEFADFYGAMGVGLFGSVMTLTLCPVPVVSQPANVV